MSDIDVNMPDGFEAVSVLGKGAMGTVYKSWQPKLKRHVAVKTCTNKESIEAGQDIGRLEDEALTIAQLNHPNIVSLIDVFRDEEAIYLIMEHLDGPPLSRLLNPKIPMEDLGAFAELVQPLDDRRVLREEWILEIAHSVAKALEYAHERDVLHRDIKPANIILTDSRNTKLLDFSIARNVNQEKGRTVAGTIFGTVQYMSPEQILSTDLDGRTDIYSLGCTLYHLATGKVPFTDDNEITICMNHVNTPPVDISEINPMLSEVCAKMIMRCLEKDPEDRFKNSTELSIYSKKVLRGVSTGMDLQAIEAMDTGEFNVRTPKPDDKEPNRDGPSTGTIQKLQDQLDASNDRLEKTVQTPGVDDLDNLETNVEDMSNYQTRPNISGADTIKEEDEEDSFAGKQVLTEPSVAAGGDPDKQPKPPEPPKTEKPAVKPEDDPHESFSRSKPNRKKRGLEELASQAEDLDVSAFRRDSSDGDKRKIISKPSSSSGAPVIKSSSYEPRSVVGSLVDAKTAELKRQREKQKKLVQSIIAIVIFIIFIIILYILRF